MRPANRSSSTAPRIGVLALQGAFREHAVALRHCGATVVDVRTAGDLEGLSGMVLPGGESTVMGKLLVEWDMLQPLRALCCSGIPVFGTCAGLILLCTDIVDHPEQPGLRILDASVRRNAFGRQKESFSTMLEDFAFEALRVSTHHFGEKRRFPQNPRRVAAAAALASAEHFQRENALEFNPFPSVAAQAPEAPMEAVFIRAPLLERTGPGVQVLARVTSHEHAAVAIRQGNILATSFHPELTSDRRLHQWVVDTARTV